MSESFREKLTRQTRERTLTAAALVEEQRLKAIQKKFMFNALLILATRMRQAEIRFPAGPIPSELTLKTEGKQYAIDGHAMMIPLTSRYRARVQVREHNGVPVFDAVVTYMRNHIHEPVVTPNIAVIEGWFADLVEEHEVHSQTEDTKPDEPEEPSPVVEEEVRTRVIDLS